MNRFNKWKRAQRNNKSWKRIWKDIGMDGKFKPMKFYFQKEDFKKPFIVDAEKGKYKWEPNY